MPIYSKTFSSLLPRKDPNSKKRSKEQALNDDSSQLIQTKSKKKKVLLNNSQYLSLADECKNYTREQVRTLLIRESEKKKLLLSREKIEQLYNINFDGQYIHAFIYDKLNGREKLLTKLKQLPDDQLIILGEIFVYLNFYGNRSQILIDTINSLDLKAYDILELYTNAQRILLNENPSKQFVGDLSEFKKILFENTTIEDSEAKLGSPNFGNRFESTNLPIYNNNNFAKHQLAYFSKFHYKMEKDDEILERVNHNKQSALMFMGASGVGKTAAAIRLLCKTPGMLLTCTNSIGFSSGLTNDYLMEEMYEFLIELDCYDLYGSIEQTILLVYICRLIYILKLIKNAKENINIILPFEGILPYLAFMQLNGKTSSSDSAFYLAISKYLYTPTTTLQDCCKELIQEIISELNENSKLFKIKQEFKNFIIVIDDAKVYGQSFTFKNLIGLNGKKVGLLPIIAKTITDIKLFHVSIFMGTNLETNVGKVFKYFKNENIKIRKYYDFGLISRDDIIKFLQKHIKIPEKELINLEKYLNENHFKFFRRRIVTFVLEELKNVPKNVKNRKLVSAFELSRKSSLQELTALIVRKCFNNQKDDSKIEYDSIQLGIIDAFVNYIAHYRFPFLKNEFHVDNEQVADALLYSAFSSPDYEHESNFIFSSRDFLGFESAQLLLDMIINERKHCQTELLIYEKEKVMKYVIERKIDFIMKKTNIDDIDRKHVRLLKLEL